MRKSFLGLSRALIGGLCLLGLLGLTGCGGGGGSGDSGTTGGSGSTASGNGNAVPVAAAANVQGLIGWASTLPADDTAPPLNTDAFKAPVDDTAQATPIV